MELPICCGPVEDKIAVESMFLMVVLNYYDGPTSGIMQCKSCSNAYRFTMIDWDDDQNIRIHALAPFPPESFRQIVDLLSQYEHPKWPIWFPLRQYTSDQLYDAVEKQIGKRLELASSPTLIAAFSQWGDQILAVRIVAEADVSQVQDWFSLKGSKPTRDWFSFLGLVQKADSSSK